jgi:RHS repeat-associated protein
MASTQITQRCTYRYDPLDRLINQTQPDTPTHQRFYCKSRLATEIQGATKHSIIQHDDLLLAQQQREGDTLDTTLLITDLQRSVLHTLKKATQAQPIAYSPYGHRPAFSGLLSLLGFNGERADPVTGHYLLGNGYRAFNPVLMRFNSPDSWSPFGEGGLNSYAYCIGDPTNWTDRNGHAPNLVIRRPYIPKLSVLARSAIAKKLEKTYPLGPEGPQSGYKLLQRYPFKNGAKSPDAYLAIDIIERLEKKIHPARVVDKLYNYHRKKNPDPKFLDNNSSPSTPEAQETLIKNYKSMLEFIEDRSASTPEQYLFSWDRLELTAAGSNMSNLDLSAIQIASHKHLASKYLDKIENTLHQNSRKIQRKIEKIRNKHFEY